MSVDKLMPDIPEKVIESLASTILPSIQKYFDSEEGQREFAERKEKRSNVMAKSVQDDKLKLHGRDRSDDSPPFSW